jgi:hypothetical protein
MIAVVARLHLLDKMVLLYKRGFLAHRGPDEESQ